MNKEIKKNLSGYVIGSLAIIFGIFLFLIKTIPNQIIYFLNFLTNPFYFLFIMLDLNEFYFSKDLVASLILIIGIILIIITWRAKKKNGKK